MKTAFVLGGGGQLGAGEVGMLRALLERAIAPDLVIGTSVGAINGAAVATSPTVAMAERLARTWADIEGGDVVAGSLLGRRARPPRAGTWTEIDARAVLPRSLLGRLATLARTGTHLHGNEGLRAMLTEALEIP